MMRLSSNEVIKVVFEHISDSDPVIKNVNNIQVNEPNREVLHVKRRVKCPDQQEFSLGKGKRKAVHVPKASYETQLQFAVGSPLGIGPPFSQ
jgi:hypothetical protein